MNEALNDVKFTPLYAVTTLIPVTIKKSFLTAHTFDPSLGEGFEYMFCSIFSKMDGKYGVSHAWENVTVENAPPILIEEFYEPKDVRQAVYAFSAPGRIFDIIDFQVLEFERKEVNFDGLNNLLYEWSKIIR